jgi:amino acid transporter
MSSQLEPYALPPAVRRVASAFRITGLISFWAQLVLAVVSTIVLIFAAFNLGNRSDSPNPGTSVGVFFAFFGLVLLYAGVYWAFSYIRLSRRLQAVDPKNRPKPRDATQALRIGLTINLIGMLLTLLGAQAIVGSLLAKSLSQPQGTAIFAERFTQFVQPLDIFIVQANTNTVLAHFIGVVASLWLIRAMSRQ